MDRTINATRVASLLGSFDRSPAYRGLAEALRALITDGRLPVGVRLPSERELTDALEVSRTTVARAYAELREHGFLASRQGSGSVARLPGGRGHRGDHLLTPGVSDDDRPDTTIDLTCAAPTPGPGVVPAYERALAALPAYLSGTGYYPSGLLRLREAVAAWYDARGLPTDPAQVMIVPGALAGVALAARALLSAGDRVVIESPSYPNAIATVKAAGARLVGADVGTGDWDTELVAATVRQVAPRAAYLIPDFHNPTGALLDEDGRSAVARSLGRARATAIVDESMVELALDGQPLPAPFACFHEDTLSVGSLSKPFWGGLRVGWVRAPAHRMDALVRARLALDLGSPLLEQLVGAEILAEPEELLAHRRTQLAASRDAALEALAEHLPEWRVRRPGGGLNLWCELPRPVSSTLTSVAERHDVLLAPGPAFAPEGGLDRYLRIPYTQPADLLREGVARIGRAWEEARSLPSGGPENRPTLVA